MDKEASKIMNNEKENTNTVREGISNSNKYHWSISSLKSKNKLFMNSKKSILKFNERGYSK